MKRIPCHKKRTNRDRVAELNAILGPVKERDGWYFSLLMNAREFKHPYALCYKMSPERSLDFRGMKAMARRMRAAFDAGGDRHTVYLACNSY